MFLEFAGRTDVGRRREHNEDALLLAPEFGLFAVADGMGGHAAGEVASRIAIESLEGFFHQLESAPDEPWPLPPDPRFDEQANRLVVGLRVANQRIREAAREEARHGMGTTCVAALIDGAQARIAWMGDSRAYVLRQGVLLPATSDHSLANELLTTGRLRPEELEHFEHRNVITRALGADHRAEADVTAVTLERDDLLLLCSDGLTGMLPDGHLAGVLSEAEDLDETCRRLIADANDAGGYDNITVVLVRWLGED